MNVVIAGGDVLTSYGRGMDNLWNGLLKGRTSIGPTNRFRERDFVSDQAALVPDLQQANGESRSIAMLSELLSPLSGTLDPQTPLLLATTVGEIECVERAILGDGDREIADASPAVLLGRVKQLLGLDGPAAVVSSACASSTVAIAMAASRVRSGETPAVLVVAVDTVSELVYSGFSTLLSLSEDPAAPFDARHCGLTLGEGAAWALITRGDHPAAAKNAVSVLGWSSTTDAVHMTAPDRSAGGLIRAARAACAMAGRTPEDISFIAAHGTATLHNDAMEMTAFRAALPGPVPTFSIKGGIGHTLASAGLIQILVSSQALQEGLVLPTVGLSEPAADAAGWVSTECRAIGREAVALSTNSGFGGVNTAILLGRPTTVKVVSPLVAGVAIRSVAWHAAGEYGALSPRGLHATGRFSLTSDTETLSTFTGRPLRYGARMNAEVRSSIVGASLAMSAAGWTDRPPDSIGTLAMDYGGCLQADVDYFCDYVANGRSLGRASLFIYTLPTSMQGEIAIALGLAGPTLHLHADRAAAQSMLDQAARTIRDGEAGGMLVLWSDREASVCAAIGPAGDTAFLANFDWDRSPSELAAALAAQASRV